MRAIGPGWSAPCRRRRRIPNWRDRRLASGRSPRSVPQRQPLAHRHYVVVGDRVRLHSTSNAWASAVLPRETDAKPASCAGPGAPCAGAAPPRRALGAARQPQPMTLPITAFRVTFPSSAAIWLGRKSGLPELFSVVRRDRRPGSIPSSHCSLRVARSFSKRRCDSNFPQTLQQNPLALAGHAMRAPAFTQNIGNG